MRNSQVGDLLVATTEVDGTILNRGVCLLVYESDETAVGVMLNRPLQTIEVQPVPSDSLSAEGSPMQGADPTNASVAKSNRLAEHLPASKTSSENEKSSPTKATLAIIGSGDDPDAGKILVGKSLHFGGPLAGPIVAVHGAAELAEAEAGEGIFVAAQRDNLEALLQAGQPHPYRLIVGHLGWSQEQLSAEIEAGVWHRMPATAEILLTADEWLWPKLIRAATAGSLSRWLGATHVADAHLLN
jgi:putative transcriptional regulator